MAKSSNGKSEKKGTKPSRATRQARWISIVFLSLTVVLILSMVLSLVK